MMPVEVLADDPQVAGVRAEEEVRRVADQRHRARSACRSRRSPPSAPAAISTCPGCAPPRRSSRPSRSPTMSPTTGTRPMMKSSPTGWLMPGTTKLRSSTRLHRLDPARGPRRGRCRAAGGAAGFERGGAGHVRSPGIGAQPVQRVQARGRSASTAAAASRPATSATAGRSGYRRRRRSARSRPAPASCPRVAMSGAVADARDQLGDRLRARLARGARDTSARCRRARRGRSAAGRRSGRRAARARSPGRSAGSRRRAGRRAGSRRARRAARSCSRIGVVSAPRNSAMRACAAASRSGVGHARPVGLRGRRGRIERLGQDRVGRRPAVGIGRGHRRAVDRQRNRCAIVAARQEARAVGDEQAEQPGGSVEADVGGRDLGQFEHRPVDEAAALDQIGSRGGEAQDRARWRARRAGGRAPAASVPPLSSSAIARPGSKAGRSSTVPAFASAMRNGPLPSAVRGAVTPISGWANSLSRSGRG